VEVSQIKINNRRVGIIGLGETLEDLARKNEGMGDEALQAELIERLSQKNYIPDSVKESYAKAFLREFKKFVGEPYEEEPLEGIEVKVLGPGCAQCDRLEKEIIEIMSELKLQADIEHVRDIKEIASYGVLGSPALIINGKVKAVGSVPPRHKIIAWLKRI